MSVEVRGVKKNNWRMQSLIDQGVNGNELRSAEDALWGTFVAIERQAVKPPYRSELFQGARRIGFGWEWAVYTLPGQDKVAKVPRGLFSEVNEPKYLEDAQDCYLACSQYIAPFTPETSFARINDTNVIFQRQLNISDVSENLNPNELSSRRRTFYRQLGEGLTTVLEEYNWMPDIWLHRGENGLWSMRDVVIEDDLPQVPDFTAVYDPYRLSPERTREEVKKDNQLLKEFISDMS